MDQQAGSYATVQGGALYYEIAGSGPAVVLIHAGIADSSMWDAQMPLLAERYTVVRYDTRGFGRTRTEDVPFSNRQDLAELLDQLGIARAAVVGVSRGGQIAIDFALEFPERVTALVPVCAALGGYEQPESDYSPAEIALFDQMEAAEAGQNHAQVAELDVRLWVDGADQPAGRAAPVVRQQVYAMCLNNYQRHTASGQPQPLSPPAAGRLSEISCPTLVISGDFDVSSCRGAAVIVAAQISGARHVAFADAAHMPSLEQPERFNQILLEFLAGAL